MTDTIRGRLYGDGPVHHGGHPVRRLAEVTDCRTPDGITVQLVDSIINGARLLRTRDLTGPAVMEALEDLRDDEDLAELLLAGITSPDGDACADVEADGQTIRVRGEGPMDETDRLALGEVVRAARHKLQAQQAAGRAAVLREAAEALLAEDAHEDRCSYGPSGTCDCALGRHYRWLNERADHIEQGAS